MSHAAMMGHFKKWHEKFKITKELKGDKLIVTFSGKPEDLAMLDKKLDAMHTLMGDCCQGESCC